MLKLQSFFSLFALFVSPTLDSFFLPVSPLQEWKVTRLTFEYDPEPYGRERDGAIIKMAQEFGVETIVRNSHTLYNMDRFVSDSESITCVGLNVLSVGYNCPFYFIYFLAPS